MKAFLLSRPSFQQPTPGLVTATANHHRTTDPAGDGQLDTFRLTCSGRNLKLAINGTPTLDIDPNLVTQLQINGDCDDDLLTINGTGDPAKT